jgi:hypothetical protein
MMQALDKYNVEKDIAAYIKKEFDKKYNPTWHCIVGRNFGMEKDNCSRSMISGICASLCMTVYSTCYGCRFLCNTRNKAFCILLPRTSGYTSI